MHLNDFQNQVYPLKDKLFRFANWMLHHHEDAEDIVQEVFLKLWKKRDDLDKYNSLEALAMKITKNSCINKLKSQKITQDISSITLQSPQSTPLENSNFNEMKNILKSVIEQLPIQQKMVIQLKSVEGFEIAEVADIMEITPNNTRVVLSRARKNIKTALEKHYGHDK